MRFATLIAGAVLAVGMATVSTPSMAGPHMPMTSVAAGAHSNIVAVDHHGHHFRHHRWGGPRIYFGPSFGYGYGYGYGHRYNRCRHVRQSCGYNFGWGTRSFYRCIDRRGC